MSGDDDDDREPESAEEALTQELKRIDAESDAVEVDFEGESADRALDVREDRDGDEFDGLVWALPGLARMAAKAWVRGALWGVGTGVRIGGRLARAAVDPRETVVLVREVGGTVRLYAREFLGISDLERRVRRETAATDARRAPARPGRDPSESPPPPDVALRTRGAQLLRRSADVSEDDRIHPAYARIIAELAPDEGRILRLLATDGPQPVVDVKALNLIGVGSQLVAEELSMIGPEAGLRHLERIPQYLINLTRLGLICFSDEPLADSIRYQVLEAQPEVMGAIKEASRAKTLHRSLRLTPFGQQFCDVALPLDLDEVEELTED